MSIHFLLGLPYDVEKEKLKKVYKKKLLSLHPDRSKSDTTFEFLQLKNEYYLFEKNNSYNENFVLKCKIEDVNNIKCRCGTFYDICNKNNNKIECETCSCYILISI